MTDGRRSGPAAWSRLTLGTAQLGMPYGIGNRTGKPDNRAAGELLQAAVEGGVRCYDTAGGYGESENVLGQFFAGQEKPFFISKVRIQPAWTSSMEELERNVRQVVARSIQRLRISALPMLLIHNPMILQSAGGAVNSVLSKLLEEGSIESAGLSVSANTEEELRLTAGRLEDDLYTAVQIPMNVLDHRPLHSGLLEQAGRTGTRVMVRSLFLQGLILMEPEQLPSHLQEAAPLLLQLRELAAMEGISLAQLAVSFIRDIPEVDSLIIGAETAGQVGDNLRLLEGPGLSASARDQILSRFRHVPEELISPHLWAGLKPSVAVPGPVPSS